MRSLIKEFNEKIAGRKEYWIPLLFYTFGAYGFSMLNRTVGADDLATPLYVNDTYWLRELRWGAVLWKKLFSFGACVPFLDKFLSVCLLMLAGTAFSCILFMINGKKDRPLLYTVAACSFITFPIICEIWEFTCGGTLIVPGDFFCTFVILLWLLSAQVNLQPPEGKSSIARRIKTQRILQSQARTCLLAGILLTPVISSAESIAPVYVTTVLIILFYRYCVRGTAPGRKTAWFFEGVRFAIPLVISFILRLVVGYGIMAVLHLLDASVDRETVPPVHKMVLRCAFAFFVPYVVLMAGALPSQMPSEYRRYGTGTYEAGKDIPASSYSVSAGNNEGVPSVVSLRRETPDGPESSSVAWERGTVRVTLYEGDTMTIKLFRAPGMDEAIQADRLDLSNVGEGDYVTVTVTLRGAAAA